jgi:hypothetical protein
MTARRRALAALVFSIGIGATATHAGPLGFGGVSLGDSEADVHRLFPKVDCRVVTGVTSSKYRCFADAAAWGMPTRVSFMFSDHDRSVRAIVLNFAPEYYGQVLPRLVLEFGQATEQRGASFFWKTRDGGVILEARGKGERFLVFITSAPGQ